MENHFPWLAAIEALAKLTAAASLFAYLLHRAGLRLAAVITVTLAHVTAMFCAIPAAPGEFVFATTVTLGTCTYAILAVHRPWLKTGIVATCLTLFGALLAQASRVLLIVSMIPLALWIGFMVTIRDWARTLPKTKPNLRERL